MIQAIPAQPLALNDTRFQGCPCYGFDRCLLVGQEDVLQVQVAGVLCDGEPELLEDTSTTFGGSWEPGEWQQLAGGLVRQTCIDTTGIDGDPAPLQETGFTATVGTVYTLTFTIQSLTVGSVIVTFGGVDLGTYNAPGTYTATVEAVSTASYSFDNGEQALTACISYASAKETNTDLQVAVYSVATGLSVDSWTYGTQPQRFAFDRDHFNVYIPIGEIGSGGLGLPDACYFIRVIDNCDDVTLESQCISVGLHSCAIRVTACNANDVGNIYFSDTFTLSMLLMANIVRPTYSYNTKEERFSNGLTNRYYADRQSSYELKITYLDEFGHDFVSTLALYDHIYFGQTEYVVKAETYTPEYNDVWDDQAPITLRLIPKQELYRKVRCAEDTGNCAPPPNYWVENTGPNTDYILNETDGSRIPLHS